MAKSPFDFKYKTPDDNGSGINTEAVRRRMRKRKPGMSDQNASGNTTDESKDEEGNSRYSSVSRKKL